MLWASHLRRMPSSVVQQLANCSGAARVAAPLTFCIPHFNAPEFLDVTLSAVRKHHDEARIIVSDALSTWGELQAARIICRRHQAELHPLATRRSHTGLLKYMFARVQSPIAVYLDQDCVLLARLDPLFAEIRNGRTLIGPKDEMRLTHPTMRQSIPEAAGTYLRCWPEFIHASLMVVDVERIREWTNYPFRRLRSGPEFYEQYHAITALVRSLDPDSILPLCSAHSGYGVGQVYRYGGKPLAYHNWYSGRVFGQQGKLDVNFDVDWLRSEAARFIIDYRAGRLDLDCPGAGADPTANVA